MCFPGFIRINDKFIPRSLGIHHTSFFPRVIGFKISFCLTVIFPVTLIFCQPSLDLFLLLTRGNIHEMSHDHIPIYVPSIICHDTFN